MKAFSRKYPRTISYVCIKVSGRKAGSDIFFNVFFAFLLFPLFQSIHKRKSFELFRALFVQTNLSSEHETGRADLKKQISSAFKEGKNEWGKEGASYLSFANIFKD